MAMVNIKNYDDIKREYELIRQLNLNKYLTRKEKVYKDNPELKKLDDEILSEYVKLIKEISDDKKESSFTNGIDTLKNKKNKYLEEKGIDANYLDMIYTCDKCKDTGFVDGKKCKCYIQKEIKMFDKISHFSEYVKEDNFANMNVKLYNQDIIMADGKTKYKDYMKRVLEHIADTLKNIDKESYNALFVGATGTGKTFLSRCIGAEYMKRNKTVLYINVNEYLDSLKPDGESLEKYAIICDLFILDDLGTENVSDFVDSKLNYIIDKRIQDKKSTIISTNLMPDEMKKRYLNSMISRIMNVYTKINFYGEDLRREKNGNF